ncbi:MAG TPA: PD-(D/E)XK nuclease family protein, partial [Planctomycetaceae bacterium]|nr:PD-(D/E)XK nuclease family protein [Planctomycetaceae bacterium]
PPSAPSETAPPVTAAGVLRAALCGTQPAPPEAVLYEHGDAAWSRSSSCPAGEAASLPSAPETSATRPTTEPLTIRLAEASARRTRGLERHSPSGLQGGTVVRLEQRLFTQPSTAADRGTLWHAWLEQVEWLDDGEPDDEALLRQARRLATAGLDVSAELAAFRRLLKTPEMQNALSRTAYQTAGHAGWPPEVTAALQAGTARLLVEREHGFALREEDAILTGSIDRLVLALSNGQEALHNPAVLAAHVLDFKTDQIEGDERLLSERSEYYRPQLDGYRRAVAALYGLRDQAVTTRLMFLTPLL